MKILIVPLISLWSIHFCLAQTSTGDFSAQRNQLIFYNIGISAAGSAIGSLINKKPDEIWYKVALKGFSQGALGGYLRHEGKNLTYKITEKEKLEYAWGAKLLHAAGSSIIENASSNRNFWEKWHMNFGPIRMELETKDELKFRAKVLPAALIGNIVIATKGKFSLETTLKMGTPVFLASDSIHFGGSYFNGLGVANSIAFNKNFLIKYPWLAHEYVHTLEYEDYIAINSWLDKPIDKWKTNSGRANTIFKYMHFDIPQYGFFLGIFFSQGVDNDCYYSNFFEMECENYALREFIDPCQP